DKAQKAIRRCASAETGATYQRTQIIQTSLKSRAWVVNCIVELLNSGQKPSNHGKSTFRLTGITCDVILYCMEIVQDTNVFVAALRSQEGASAEVLDRCLARDDQAVMGAALFAEYEELVQRDSLWRDVPVTAAEREALLDDFCAAAIWQPIYFRWRPNL